MASKLRARLTYANTMATVAVFLALAGGAYAGLSIPRNSVGTKQLKNDAVKSSKVRNGSLQRRDFGRNQIPRGPQGPQGLPGATGQIGPQGPEGPAGNIPGFARVDADGTLHDVANNAGFENPPIQHKNVTDANIEHTPASGTYCFGGLPFTPRTAMVSIDNGEADILDTNKIVSVGVQRGANLGGCGANFQQARVRIVEVNEAAAPAAADFQFTIWFED